MKNPEYRLGMTYEEYSVWHSSLDENDLFAPPDDPSVWNEAEKMKGRIEALKAHQPSSSFGHLSRQMQVQQAEQRLEYLLFLNRTDQVKRTGDH